MSISQTSDHVIPELRTEKIRSQQNSAHEAKTSRRGLLADNE